MHQDWNWYLISMYIKIEEIKKNPNLPWNRYGLSHNRYITIDDMLHLELPNAIGDWNWSNIQLHLTLDQIKDNSELQWNREILSCNTNVN